MKAVIMAGGKGARIAEVAKDIPKPMIPVLGKPVLEYQIRSLTAGGVQDITLVIGHLGDAIRNYFGDGAAFGARIRYIAEEKPLGTAGALFYLKEEYGLRGIHLDTAESELPYGYRGNVSRTCHDISELREAKKKSNYVFSHCKHLLHIPCHKSIFLFILRKLVDRVINLILYFY